MSSAVLALVLGSAVVHAAWNLPTQQLGPAVRSASLVFYWGGEGVRVLLVSPVALRAPGDLPALWRAQRARVLGIALLSPLSYIRILLALRHADVGLVAAAPFAGGVVALALG